MDTRRFFFKQLFALPFVGRAVESAIEQVQESEPIPEPIPEAPSAPRISGRISSNEYMLTLTRNGREQLLAPVSVEFQAPDIFQVPGDRTNRDIFRATRAQIEVTGWTTVDEWDDMFAILPGPVNYELTTGLTGDNMYRGTGLVTDVEIDEGKVRVVVQSRGAWIKGVAV